MFYLYLEFSTKTNMKERFKKKCDLVASLSIILLRHIYEDQKASLCLQNQIDEILDNFVLFGTKKFIVCPSRGDC